MITKRSLIENRNKANTALLELKQKYDYSKSTAYLVVEGKDDVAFYTCICLRYARFIDSVIIPANSRENAINTYNKLDWNIFSKERVFFFVDRDLSDFTNEYTPNSSNVYITDYYSIENSVFDYASMITAIKVYYGVVDLSYEEISLINNIYNNAFNDFLNFYHLIMCWILLWRMNNYTCYLNNLNDKLMYKVKDGVFEIKNDYQTTNNIVGYIHKICGVEFVDKDISPFSDLINQHGGVKNVLRGKYLKTFFIQFFLSIGESFNILFPERKKLKASVSIGQENVLSLLCGYIPTPKSLDEFMLRHNV